MHALAVINTRTGSLTLVDELNYNQAITLAKMFNFDFKGSYIAKWTESSNANIMVNQLKIEHKIKTVQVIK